MTGVYRFAEIPIEVSSAHSSVHQLCEEYRCGGIPCFAVHTTAQDIAYERIKSARESAKEGRETVSWPDAYLETLAVYRKIAERMPDYDAFLFHGSAIAVDGDAYIFTARSGTGKSTHARLWRKLLGSRAMMVNDDKPLIRVCPNGAAIVYGTPWDGKHHLSNYTSAPVKAICILDRSPKNWIRRVSKPEALPMLLQQTYRPADPDALAKTLTLLDRLNVGFYRLGCNMDISAAELSYQTMKEG